jgi:DNA-directed RNA polymerase specialized sigma24 family protein
MSESLDASRDIDRIRKELERISDKLDDVGKQVKEVDRKVERSNATQLGALASALAADDGARREALLYAAGMSIPDIARALGKSVNAVRISLSRAGLTSRKKKGSRGG